MTKIIFLSYINRSGSTYLINQLSKVQEICICPEADILYDLLLSDTKKKIKQTHLSIWPELLKNNLKFQAWKINIAHLFRPEIIGNSKPTLFFSILDTFQKTHFPNSKQIIFKHNYLIHLFNNTEFKNFNIGWIALIRDPRAIFNSQKSTINAETGQLMCTNPLLFAEYWNTYIHKIDILDTNSTELKIINYEDIINNTLTTLNDILNFIGLKPNIEEYIDNPGIHSKWIVNPYRQMHPIIDKSPEKQNIDKWKQNLSKVDIYLLNKYCTKIDSNNFKPEYQVKSIKFIFLIIKLIFQKYYFLIIQFTRKNVHKIRYNISFQLL